MTEQQKKRAIDLVHTAHNALVDLNNELGVPCCNVIESTKGLLKWIDIQ